jgi:hypothetical protein
MCTPCVDDVVCLIQAIPELWLKGGDHGVVKSIWSLPSAAYEVEFHSTCSDCGTRVLLFADQLRVEERGCRSGAPDTVGAE